MIANPLIITEIGRQKISTFHKGNPKSKDHKQNISGALKGYKKTDEHLKNMGNGIKKWAQQYNSGENNYFYGRRYNGKDNYNFVGYFKFKNKVTNNEIISSQSEFAKKFNFYNGNISALCLGKIKIYKEWICLGKENSYG
jgi:hypothetical protein